MAKGGWPVLRLSPEPWLGVVTEYAPEFFKAFKNMVEVSAYDPTSFTRWVPVGYMPHVVGLIREHKAANDAALEKARVEVEIALRPAVRATPSDAIVEHYKMLGIVPGVPPLLVEWAIYFWRRHYSGIATPTTHLLQIEESYRLICAAQGTVPK